MNAPVPRGFPRRTLLGTALLAALPGLARGRASAATHPTFDGARALRDVGRIVAIGRRNAYWHTPEDTLEKLSAESLRVVGTVILEALPAIEAELARRAR